MATALSTLVPDIRTHIPELPSFVADRELLRAAREFCEETRAWRANINVTTVASTATYTLSVPTNTELVDVISMKKSDGSTPVVPRTFKWLDENLADWRTTTSDTANYYVLESNNVVRLVYTPAAAVTYNTRIAVKPTLSATTLDDVLVNKYREPLISGALGLLFMIPRKPWSDTNLAAFHTGMFNMAKAGARTEAAEEFQTGIPRKVKYGGL